MKNIDETTKLYAHREQDQVVGSILFDQKQENRRVLLSFANSIEERDILTYDHSRRVATYAQRLARYLGWSKREARDLALAALVHDLGKTWISNKILNKTAALSLEERLIMQRHPEIGARILIGYEVHPFYVEAVLHHHESWDGQGYPSRLKGTAIPLSARILTVADVYDVLTSQRPYKAPLTTTEARARLLESSGTTFDPMILHAFVHLIDTKSIFTLTPHVYQIQTSTTRAPFI